MPCIIMLYVHTVKIHKVFIHVLVPFYVNIQDIMPAKMYPEPRQRKQHGGYQSSCFNNFKRIMGLTLLIVAS